MSSPSVGYGLSPYGQGPYGDPLTTSVASLPGSFLSWLTQKLQNYYDFKDPRIRASLYCIDAQLLNMFATELEDLQLRVLREINARSLENCPLNLDNNGLYYSVPIPASFQLDPAATSLNQVEGVRAGTPTLLSLADDMTPVPTRVSIDPARVTTAFTNPVFGSMTGANDPNEGGLSVLSITPGDLPIPNQLTFWLSGVGLNDAELDIYVEGERYPPQAFVQQRTTYSESLFLNHEGYINTKYIWNNVSKITVRGLPAGALLQVWTLGFQQPAEPDPLRPFIHHDYRGVQFQRYWEVSQAEHLLKETYQGGRDSGTWYIESYRMTGITDVAVEPYRYGLLAVAGTNLFYANRRKPMPQNLGVAALTAEPCYGLKPVYEVGKPGITRYVTLYPVPYGNAGNMFKYRWRMEDPNSGQFVITPDNVLVGLTPSVGWRRGKITPVTLPISLIGTYVFTLECVDDSDNLTGDSVPYANYLFTPLATLDLSSLVGQVQGVAYDSLGQLWVWTGSEAVPLALGYDQYILDAANRMLYVSDNYDTVNIS